MRQSRRLAAIAALALAASAVFAPVARADRPDGPHVNWERVRNPVLGYPARAVKDPALVWSHGRWVALFSSVDTRGRWRIGITTSSDLQRWSRLRFLPHDVRVEGEASPDVVRSPDGDFVVTFQSFVHDVDGGEAKLWYRTTRDFRQFSRARRLAFEVHPGSADRVIDPALVWSPAGLLLGYKFGLRDGPQSFEIARSTSGALDGPWVLVGRPDIKVLGDTVENYQFLHLDGDFELLATSNNLDRPYLFDLAGAPGEPAGWLHWSAGRQLVVPQEAWNPGGGVTGVTFEHANCAFVVDRRRIDGLVYLIYADSPDLASFGGQGHARLGMARSRDLVHWTVPAGE